jgi:TolB protein
MSAGLALFSTASAAGTGPDDALAPVADWQPLTAGESHWYAFYYAGDGSPIQVRLEAVLEGVGFAIWTPEKIYHWGLGEYVEPIGRGSDDPFAEGVLTWLGSFTISGTYYVVVEHAQNLPGSFTAGTNYYLLDVSGDGLSFSASAPLPVQGSTPTHVSVESQPKSAIASQLTGKLVFQTTYGGTFYTINVDGSDLQPVANGIDPIWSPDGEQIAFVRWEDPRGVWVVNADGSNASRVFDWSETRYPSWSPDGQEIVFSRQKGDGGGGGIPGGFPGTRSDVAVSVGRLPGGPPPGRASGSGATLGIVNTSDGAFREPLPASDTSLTPAWSPDGEQIVFAGYRGLVVQSVAGAPSTEGAESWQLTSDPRDTSPAWSPDGKKVAFVRRQHDHWEIYVIDVTTGQQTRLTDTPAWPDGTAANSVSPAWSPDGGYIAFLTDQAASTTAAGEWQIWVIAADGSNPQPMFGSELDGLVLEYAFAGERAIDWER